MDKIKNVFRYSIQFYFLLSTDCLRIIFNNKSLFLTSALFSLSLIAVLWAYQISIKGALGRYHYSHWVKKGALVTKMRLKCIEKEKLYLDKSETACTEKKNKIPHLLNCRIKTGERETDGWFQIPAPQLC